jgi:hypothetical protein
VEGEEGRGGEEGGEGRRERKGGEARPTTRSHRELRARAAGCAHVAEGDRQPGVRREELGLPAGDLLGLHVALEERHEVRHIDGTQQG